MSITYDRFLLLDIELFFSAGGLVHAFEKSLKPLDGVRAIMSCERASYTIKETSYSPTRRDEAQGHLRRGELLEEHVAATYTMK